MAAGASTGNGALLLWAAGEMSPELRESVEERTTGELPFTCAQMDCYLALPSEGIPAAGVELLRSIREGEYRHVMAVPPTGSFSRLRQANNRGPKPLRSREFPRGLPWLPGSAREKCARENAVIALCCQACEAVAERDEGFFALLHPEYLGASEHGMPPSFWDLAPVQRLAEAPGVAYGAFHLCRAEPGLGRPTPTRVLTNAGGLAGELHLGPPILGDPVEEDAVARPYLGPLPAQCQCPGGTTSRGRRPPRLDPHSRETPSGQARPCIGCLSDSGFARGRRLSSLALRK